jgi:hypothetical protein
MGVVSFAQQNDATSCTKS